MLKHADTAELRSAARALLATPALEELDKRSLMARLMKLHPELQNLLTGGGEDKPINLTVSWSSLEKRKLELDDLVNKQIPKNIEEIQIAREYGDLRENFEFKAAKEMQAVLARRRSELERDLDRARGTNFENPDTNIVSIGTVVTLKDEASGKIGDVHDPRRVGRRPGQAHPLLPDDHRAGDHGPQGRRDRATAQRQRRGRAPGEDRNHHGVRGGVICPKAEARNAHLGTFTMASLLRRRYGWLFLAVSLLAGCRSVLNLPPVQEPRGGFTVLAGLPDQASAVRVFADVGSFAGQRGFVRGSASAKAEVDPATGQPVPFGPERYGQEKLKLDLSYDAAHLRVIAYLHGPGGEGERRFIHQFAHDFSQTYAASYGGAGAITENTFTDDASGRPHGGGSTGGGGGPGSGGGGGRR